MRNLNLKTTKGLQKMIMTLRLNGCFKRNQGDFYEKSAIALKLIESKSLTNTSLSKFQFYQ
ncbi:hypothetical protein LEP1GSC016_4302 [Leptospira borgpetersenii serovar Hardjo-bovis str. Sponselee]|uniref:Uncharacterized protein n=1 Tax=Leptospira borgpetersenii serovar Hardjo-bovis str. Sponselee TaxID=1303729 RepID=M6C1L2_LEPBO|nr:hypothetical protein LBK6_12890 [Leptospira borgpetersenii serovar Hardjo]AWV70935.1 hypothetical protein B9T54_13775 [Leptospira borgpetersenii serovar Hardjo-bovis]EMJ84616.1 hypothetical protein LEP1GSC016_4302 [Leptospira borgpetersenii serovar Hardjo-bovis str. Sponselee]TQE54910.1 hypothetical protein FFZ95_02110 [Leptospira borgpetersenii]AMX62424.1 hypothetical protein LBK9_12800 [Leptospira borgpetersenii serovar Hardjo]